MVRNDLVKGETARIGKKKGSKFLLQKRCPRFVRLKGVHAGCPVSFTEPTSPYHSLFRSTSGGEKDEQPGGSIGGFSTVRKMGKN